MPGLESEVGKAADEFFEGGCGWVDYAALLCALTFLIVALAIF